MIMSNTLTFKPGNWLLGMIIISRLRLGGDVTWRQQELEVYKCEVCGNMVEVIHASDGELVYCGQPMKLMTQEHGGRVQESTFR